MKSFWAFRSPDAGRWATRCSATLPADVATGLMGPGLPIGVGLALAGRRLDRLPYRVWVLCGDTEMAEVSTWEAFGYGGRAALGNLTVVVDVNGAGRAGEIMLGRDLRQVRAFGWHAVPLTGTTWTRSTGLTGRRPRVPGGPR